jgi:hypothetical protein
LQKFAFPARAREDGEVEDSQVDELRRWADGLRKDGRPEVRAAAKAILLLSDDLLAARSQLLEERLIRQALEERDAAEEAQLPADLLGRLRTFLHMRRGPVESAEG